MLKKIILPVVALVMVSGLTACGTRATPSKVNTISVTELNNTEVKPSYFPVSVTSMEEDGQKLIVKNYEVPSSVNPYDLIEESFERNKYQYEVRDILKKNCDEQIHTKIASTQVVINSQSNDMNKILKQAPLLIDYDKDGYRGQLVLNTSAVFTESLGTKSYSYTVSETKKYTDLARNDTYYIPKVVTKNGKELSLVDVEWSAAGTTLVGNSLMPSSYNAVAYYSGTAYGSKSTGYATTISYIGEVSKKEDGGAIVSVVYQGTRLYNFTLILLLTLGLISAFVIIAIFLILKNRKPRENHEEEPVCSRDIAVERTKEAVNLNAALKEAEQKEVMQEREEAENEKPIEKAKKQKEKVKVKVYVHEEGKEDEEKG